MISFFDKSTSKMILSIISKQIGNEVLANMINELAKEGEFQKAAEIIGKLMKEKNKVEEEILSLKQSILNLKV